MNYMTERFEYNLNEITYVKTLTYFKTILFNK